MKPRNQILDVWRGVAILLVLGRHYDYFHVWQSIGWAGVDLFFVLSGFLISGLLFSEYKRFGNISVKRFWLRRAFKIYPAFYCMIAFTVGLLLLTGQSVPKQLLHDCFFLQNYLPPFWEHGWSLAVEEHFYFVLPLLLVALVKFSRRSANPFRSIPVISLALAGVCLLLRTHTVATGESFRSLEFPTHLRIDSLFFGVTLSYYKHFEEDQFQSVPRWILYGSAGILLAPVFVLAQTHVFMSATFTLTFLGFGCLLMASLTRVDSRNVALRLLAWVGYYSYSIYLWHAVLVGLVFRAFQPTLALFSAYVAKIGRAHV